MSLFERFINSLRLFLGFCRLLLCRLLREVSNAANKFEELNIHVFS